MSLALNTYSPIEALLLFQQLSVHGVSSLSFKKISESLINNTLLRHVPREDREKRLSPDALQDIFIRLLKEEARIELQKNASIAGDEDGAQDDAANPGAKRKAPSPSLPSTVEAMKNQHLIPQMVNKLYTRYKEHTIAEIREDEKNYSRLRREMAEIERGEWNSRLQKELAHGKREQHALGRQDSAAGGLGGQKSKALNAGVGAAGMSRSPAAGYRTASPATPVQQNVQSQSANTQGLQPIAATTGKRKRSKSPQVPIVSSTAAARQSLPPSALSRDSQGVPQSTPNVYSPHIGTPNGQPRAFSPSPLPFANTNSAPPRPNTQPPSQSQTPRPVSTPGAPQPYPVSNIPPYPYNRPPSAATTSSPVPYPQAGGRVTSSPGAATAGQPQVPPYPPYPQRYAAPQVTPQVGGVVLQPFVVAPQTPQVPQTSRQGQPEHAQSALPQATNPAPPATIARVNSAITPTTPGLPQEAPRRATLPPQAFHQPANEVILKNEVFRLLGTPVPSRRNSARSTPAQTPWKVRAMETRVASHRSPSPMRERSISPITDGPAQTSMGGVLRASHAMSPPPPQLEETDQISPPQTQGTNSRGLRVRGGRGGRLTRAASTTTASVRARTRSQSIMSQTSTVNEPRAVKDEPPETPADTADLDSQLEDITPDSKRRVTAVINPNKRKRGLRGRSEEPPDALPDVTTTAVSKHNRGISRDEPPSTPNYYPSVKSDQILAVKNFPRLCHHMLNTISTHKHASLFAAPVRPKDAEGYLEIIKRPTDLKTIRMAINAGARAVNAQTAEMLAVATPPALQSNIATITTRRASMTPSTLNTATLQSTNPTSSVNPPPTVTIPTSSRDASTVLLPLSEDLVPPRGIVNSAQLEKELMRMLANAVMFNPGDEGVVADAREMFRDIRGEISRFRSAERMGGVAERVGGRRGEGAEDEDAGVVSGTAASTKVEREREREREREKERDRVATATAAAAVEEDDEEIDELAPEEVGVRVSRRRRG